MSYSPDACPWWEETDTAGDPAATARRVFETVRDIERRQQ